MLDALAIPARDLDALVQQLGLLDPTDPERRRPQVAPRLRSLAGARLGLLDNRKPNAALLLQEVAALLAERYGAGASVLRAKFMYSQPAAPAILDGLAQCDAVLTAIGD